MSRAGSSTSCWCSRSSRSSSTSSPAAAPSSAARNGGASAGRRASGPRLRDGGLEGVVANGALEDAVADHEGRRAARAQRIGELVVLAELGLSGLLAERRHAQRGLRLRERVGSRSTRGVKLVMEGAELAGLRGGEAGAG